MQVIESTIPAMTEFLTENLLVWLQDRIILIQDELLTARASMPSR